MKNLDLSNWNLQEMSCEEMSIINGGEDGPAPKWIHDVIDWLWDTFVD